MTANYVTKITQQIFFPHFMFADFDTDKSFQNRGGGGVIHFPSFYSFRAFYKSGVTSNQKVSSCLDQISELKVKQFECFLIKYSNCKK